MIDHSSHQTGRQPWLSGPVYKWEWVWSKWELVEPEVEARRVAAGPDACPWVITDDHQVYKLENGKAIHIPSPDA